MLRLLEYRDPTGRTPFREWFGRVDPQATIKITAALERLAQGNVSNVKGVGGGVLEYRLDFGPGYRIYFGRDGREIVILLAGGTKHRQQQDIETALVRWADYKRRKN